MTPRLLVDGLREAGQVVALDTDQSHYVQRVLRLREGDPLQVFDGRGARWSARLAAPSPGGAGRNTAAITLIQAQPSPSESPLRLTLVQCISSAERMDFTIEKAVELGASAILPVASARSVVKLDDERARKRLAHWQRLVVAACMQCGRDTVPPVHAPVPLVAWLSARPRARPGWSLDPLATQSLAASATRHVGLADADLLVGPESGLTPEEIALAGQAGLLPVSLGPRVLRTETAGLAALALLQGVLGDLA